MREHSSEDWQAFNKDQRELQAKVTVYFTGQALTFTHDDCLISFNATKQLTDTINTPFDLCCADTCSVTFYNCYTGIYKNKEVEEYKIFDPLKNPDLQINTKILIEIRALREDDEWSKWVPLGIFYATDIAVNDDRLTAVIQGSDILSQIFNKDIPRQPVYFNKSVMWFLEEFCKVYNLPIVLEYEIEDKLQYAFLQSTVKATIQDLIRSTACVATVQITDDLKEVLVIKPFKYFAMTATSPVRDYSNYTDEDYMQFITLRYNKSLLSYSSKTRTTWYKPSISDTTTMYSYNAINSNDFMYSKKDGYYTYGISYAEMNATPMHCMDYFSVCVPYHPGNLANNAVYHTLSTQYKLTADVRSSFTLNDDEAYSLTAVGRSIKNEPQTLPEIRPKDSSSLLNDYTTIDTINDYLEVDLPYCQYKEAAQQRLLALETWASCALQTVDIQLRGNPFVELTDGISIDAQVYDIDNFSGILWQETYNYQSGGLSVDAVLVNKEAFTLGIEVYDVAAQQRINETTVSNFYIVGKCGNYFGLWSVPEEYSEYTGFYSLQTKLKGNITDMAVAFDGIWDLTPNFRYYTLHTENVPWIFYCMDGKLYAKYSNNTAILLADDAIFCAAERGFYPRDYEDIATDQGIVVAYIDSNNKAWYRTYALVDTNKKAWLDAEKIIDIEESVTYLQIHRLNDYRLGICITTETKSYWIYTERVYAQMAFRPEQFSMDAAFHERSLLCIIFNEPNVTPQPNFTWTSNVTRTEITITSDMEMEGITETALLNAFTTNGVKPIHAERYDGYTLKYTFTEPIPTSTLQCTLKFTPNIWFAGDAATKQDNALGWVVIQGTWTTTLDFRTTKNTYYNDQFKLIGSNLMSLSTVVKPRKLLTANYNEQFTTLAGMPNINISVKPREIISTAQRENFEISAGNPDIYIEIISVNISPI